MSNDRCQPHGVSRCVLCNMKKGPAIAEPVVLDAQALEAKKRLEDTTPVLGEWTDPSPWDAPVAATLVAPLVEAAVEKIKDAVFSEPTMLIAPKGTHLAGNPIVDAAAAYTSAQERVDTYIGEVMKIQDELTATKVLLEEAKADRDTKKTVLQALVGGAS
jgi:hypothetical protein